MSSETKISKKFPWKKVLFASGGGFLLLLAALISIPFFFKDKIKDLALVEANKMLKADVAVGDFDLTIFSTFPKVKMVFEDVSITGREEFEDIKLVDVEKLEARLDFWSVVSLDDIAIRSIRLDKPMIHVKVLENGVANYDIVKSEEELKEENAEETVFNLSLNYYEVNNGYIIYDDADTTSSMYAEIHNISLSGKGDMTADIIDFKANSTLDELVFRMGETMNVDLKDIQLDADGKLNGNLSDFVINTSFKELNYKDGGTKAALVDFTTVGDVSYTPEAIEVKTKIASEELSFIMDGLSYLTKVKTDLDLDLVMETKEESTKFVLKENNLKLNALNLSFDGFYEMLDDKDNIDLVLNADRTSFKDLLSLVPAFYHTGYESMVAQGSMDLQGFVRGEIASNSYPAWDFKTKVANASIKYPDVKSTIENVNIVAGTTFPGGSNLDRMTVDVDQLKASFAGNTIDGNFYLKTPMSDPFMKTKLNANIDLATLDQVYPMEEKYEGKLISDLALEGNMSSLEKEEYEKFNASGNLQLEDFKYEMEGLSAPVDVSKVLFEFSPQRLHLAQLDAKMGESDFALKGDIQNYMGYLFRENEELKGNFDFVSSYINVDELMPASEETSEETSEESEEELEAFMVPKNIDFTLNTKIDKLKYDGMDIHNINGNVKLKDEAADLQNLSLNALGGSVGLSGKYSTVEATAPKVDFNWSLKEIDIQELVNNFLTIDALAPVAKYAQGKISSDFSMSSNFTSNFEPVLSSLSGFGNLLSNKVTITGFEPLEKLGNALNIDKLKKQTIDNINAYFEFKDGKVDIKPYTIKLGGIQTTIGGNTSFEQDIDLVMNMVIPKADLPKQAVEAAEKAIAQAKKLPFFKMEELPNEIPVTAFITNKITNPKVETNLKEKLMELGGNIKEDIKDYVDDKVEEIKDTVREVIDEKIEDTKEQVREEIEKQKKEILDAAQKQADKLIEEAGKLADKTRETANKNADKLVEEAGSNPIKKRAAELAANGVRNEGEKAAKKIEDEAKQRADDVMRKAQEQADRL